MATTRAKKTAPKPAATATAQAEHAPQTRKRGAVMARWGNKNAVGNRGGTGRPRGRSPDAYTVKLNIAISPAQREKLENAAKNAGIKYTEFLRNFINSL